MRIQDKTIIFKSLPEHWQKEHSGIKPNTVRHLDADEYEALVRADVEYIKIVNTVTHEAFTREIEDITCGIVGKMPVWVFSWGHYADVEPDGYYYEQTAAVRDIINVRMKGIA